MRQGKRIVRHVLLLLTALASLAGAALTGTASAAATVERTVPIDASDPDPTGAGTPDPASAGTPGPGTPGAGTRPSDAGVDTASADTASDPRAPGAPGAPGPEIFTGRGFDTCNTPALDTLNAWRNSSYRAIGVYFGGRGRACKTQTQLNRDWVRTATDGGWKILPVYVGSQAPCVRGAGKKHVAIGSQPTEQGRTEGLDAVRSASALGMTESSPLYLDMEAYDHTNEKCAGTTLDFIQSWNREVRRNGYLPGFYSSADSGVRHMESARQAGAQDLPEVMWFARWGVEASVTGEPSLSATGWNPHRRIHQYAGDVTETYGGKKMAIDRNLVDAPVAVIG
ncbi:DUF1906 domain-containing protein [Streptomyces sp. H27-D2]|uniref:DUF1906 domain-containing protein n=1 Tax=Streptomyces sp. H27-D2 TaxID=3046304 RepID=UPI002DB76EE1|nr:glycoside hydrolase domain-containing protein [Streptomyces sp. H27-D2]MEC4018892.1 glycoside hydrolase domain-containing protein [Streptomyces sp. H27-D2]